MRAYRADLHVHTVLSPCAEVEMIPPLIVAEAIERGIDIIAITDHNASANVQSVQQAAQRTPLTVIAGMELQTREEVHLLCLFDSLEILKEWQSFVDRHLPNLANRPDYFGEQFIVDETGDFLAREHRLLLTSTDLSISEAIGKVNTLGGLAIPAHVNRKAFGLIANLGFLPEDVPVEAVEISRHISPDRVPHEFPQLSGIPLVQNGDVHRLDEFLGVNLFEIEKPTLPEIRMAMYNRDGRKSKILPLPVDNLRG